MYFYPLSSHNNRPIVTSCRENFPQISSRLPSMSSEQKSRLPQDPGRTPLLRHPGGTPLLTPRSVGQGLRQGSTSRDRSGSPAIRPSPAGFLNRTSPSLPPQIGEKNLGTVDEGLEIEDFTDVLSNSEGQNRSSEPLNPAQPPGDGVLPRSPPPDETTRDSRI